jgi:hypothetical protein
MLAFSAQQGRPWPAAAAEGEVLLQAISAIADADADGLTLRDGFRRVTVAICRFSVEYDNMEYLSTHDAAIHSWWGTQLPGERQRHRESGALGEVEAEGQKESGGGRWS